MKELTQQQIAALQRISDILDELQTSQYGVYCKECKFRDGNHWFECSHAHKG